MSNKKGRIWWFTHVIFRNFILDIRINYYRKIFGMTIGKGVKISLNAKLDKTNPRGIHIGDDTYIAFDAAILAHDMSRLKHENTYIGARCFIGARSIILPGVKIGDQVVIAAGSVVTKDIPSNSLAAGNPAKVIKPIKTGKLGIIER